MPNGPASSVAGIKRAKGHPDAPTLSPSPEKHRIYKRGSDSTIKPPPQPVFTHPGPSPSSHPSQNSADVFRTVNLVNNGYGTDSESDRDDGVEHAAEYYWGPEDDAPGLIICEPWTSHGMHPNAASTPTNEDPGPCSMPALESDDVVDDLPALIDPLDSEDDDGSGSEDNEGAGSKGDEGADSEDHDDNNGDGGMPGLVDVSDDDDDEARKDLAAADRLKGAKPWITAYWTVETAAQKAIRMEREAREYREKAEASRQREIDEKRKKAARERIKANERMQRHRDRAREAKIADGWIPGQKRKRVYLVERDETGPRDKLLPEHSRPHRQFKEDLKKNNKLCGRKQKEKNKKRDAKLHNWAHPLLWSQIDSAARRSFPWSPREIMTELHKQNYKDFHALTEQVIGRWIDPVAKQRGVSKWKDSVLENVELGKGNSPGGKSTRVGVLHPYPDIRKRINNQLTSLRSAGVAITLLTARGIMVAHIQEGAPHLFERRMGDGSAFRCSEVFVRRYLRNTLGWSERRATKAAQKLPENYEKILEEAFLREAHVIRDHGVPAALRVNTDQTQLVYQQGSGSTWTERGVKQVATVGQEEKRAFTLVPSISASGELLPMQGVFGGKTSASCPSPNAKRYEEALDLGYAMVPSRTGTYWSNHDTMHQLVDEIIAPYFEAKKKELDLPSTQISIWKIDCWSVHKSKEFLAWMKENHENIVVLFVPGGCTGVWQPLDVGIQRLMKLSIKRAAHRDIVDEAAGQIQAGLPPHEIKLNTTLPVLRDRSVGWIVQAIHDINDPAIITKAFKMCRVGEYNLSHASLTSREALAALRRLPVDNPALHAALTQTSTTVDVAGPVPAGEEDLFQDTDVYDDCDIPLDVVASHLASGSSAVPELFSVGENGSLTRAGDAEKSDTEGNNGAAVVMGRGLRKKIVAKRYAGPI